MPFEDEALAMPPLFPEFRKQSLGDWTLPIEFNNPVVENYAFALRPLAEAPTALIIHEGILNHFE